MLRLLPPMEAKPYCCPVEWVSNSNNRIRTTSSSTPKSTEFYLIFLALGFCLFRNIFGRPTPSDDFFESLRMLHGILVVECYLSTIFLNHLSLVEQGFHKYVGCVFACETNLLQRYLIIIQPLVLFNATEKLCYISSHMQSGLTVYFYSF